MRRCVTNVTQQSRCRAGPPTSALASTAAMDLVSFLSGFLQVAGVWGFSVLFFSGVAGAFALAFGGPNADIGREAARGGAAGFIIGIPLAIAAGLILALG